MSRRSRFVRTGKPIAMKLVERDYAILKSVAVLRLARAWHFHELHFEGRTLKVCQVRLQKLWSNGDLDRLFQPMLLVDGRAQPRCTTPVYQLTAKGSSALRSAGYAVKRPSGTPSPYRLTHDLLVLDARVAITLASARTLGTPPLLWWDETQARAVLRKYAKGHPRVIPDAAFCLESPEASPLAYLLEVDTGSEPLTRKGVGSSIEAKLTGYAALRKTGVLSRALGSKAVRVVFLVTSTTRADNILSLIAQLSVPSGLFLVGTTSGVVPHVPPGPTLRPSKVLLPVLRCARCPSWHSLAGQ